MANDLQRGAGQWWGRLGRLALASPLLVGLLASSARAQAPGAGGRGPLVPEVGGVPDTGHEVVDIARSLDRGRETLPKRLRNPRSEGSMPPDVRGKLNGAFREAMLTVREREECQGLFVSLGKRGDYTLANAVYVAGGATGLCADEIPAWVHVNHPRTMVCDRFGRLDVKEAAVQLLHEALHSAGLNEWPHQSNALRPREISALVRQHCFLDSRVR